MARKGQGAVKYSREFVNFGIRSVAPVAAVMRITGAHNFVAR